MSLYLVDFENVHDSGLNGVTGLTENDDICIFYSMKSEHMSFDTHVNIMKSAARVKYIKLRRSAKNYLDFQLVTHLGYLIGSGHPGPYFIISKDTGYDSVLDYWKDHGVTVLRQPSINYNLTQRKSTGQSPVHNTPPAIVTLKEGTVVSTPQIPMLRNDYVNPGPESFTAALDLVDLPAAEAASAKAAEPAAAETAAETPPEKKSKSSRSRKSNSRRKGPADTSPGTAADLSAAEMAVLKSTDNTETKPANASDDMDPDIFAAEPIREDDFETMSSVDDLPFDSELSVQQVRITPQSLPESFRKKVRTVLKGKEIPSAKYASIYKAIINSYDKLALNNLLVKTFGSSKGGEIYNLLKDIFTDYQSTL